MKPYNQSSFSKTRLLLITAALLGSSVAIADNMSVHTHARAQVDAVWFHGNDADKFGNGLTTTSATFPSGANVRRANLFFNGNLGHDLDYYLRVDFGRNSSSGTADHDKVRVKRAELRYHYNGYKFTFGQMYVPFGMEWTTCASDILFMERSSMSDALLERSHFGIAGMTKGEMFTFSGAVVQTGFGGFDAATSSTSEKSTRNDKFAGLARVTIAPQTGDTTYHIGLNAKYKSLNTTDGSTSVYRNWTSGPELRSRQSSNSILSTGLTANGITAPVKKFHVLGGELAAKWNSFHVQTEYMRLQADYENAPKRNYKGWYIQGGWLWTGESRPYDFAKGTFKKPEPNDKCGAWEVALRYSQVSLDNPDFTTVTTTEDTGKSNSWTFGINWFYNNHFSVKANYSQTKFKFKTESARKVKGLGLRAEFYV